ncbi:MAG TPA: DUF2059 domain-containing protein [Pyrinomonadaceae bacterium]|nr:DUF2059 domain-containing protein [Pyrinomonadaceae bacterium]
MRKYPLTAMSFLLLLCLAPAVMAQSTQKATKDENIRKLLALTDAGGLFKRGLESQLSMMKARETRVPPRFWDEVLKEVDPERFVELLIPVYDKHFSDDELKDLIAFYETPLGKKLVSEMTPIMTETAAIGAKYGEQIANRVVKRMQAEGTFPSAAPTGDGKPLPPRR